MSYRCKNTLQLPELLVSGNGVPLLINIALAFTAALPWLAHAARALFLRLDPALCHFGFHRMVPAQGIAPRRPPYESKLATWPAGIKWSQRLELHQPSSVYETEPPLSVGRWR